MLGPPLISLTHKVLLRFLPLSFPFSAACPSASSHTLCQPSALFSLSSSSSCTSFLSVDVPFDVARPATDRLAPLRR